MRLTSFPVSIVSGVLALGGCAGGLGSPAVCTVQEAASLPMEPGRALVVPGRLNQGEVRYVLDTGAEGSFVTPEAARHNNVASSRSRTRIVGIGGVLEAPNVFAEVELGGLAVRRQVPVVALPGRAGSAALGGLIGSDVLSQYDVEVSVPERRVRLWRVSGCSGDYVRWQGRHWSVPLKRTTGGRLFIGAAVDGVAVTGLLDTGADQTVMGNSAARRAGAVGLGQDPVSQSQGADGNVVQRHRHRFASLEVGPERFREPVIGVADGDLAQGDLLLGMDWLQRRRVWISWENRTVFVQPTAAVP